VTKWKLILQAVVAPLMGGLIGGAFANFSRVLPPRVYVPISSLALAGAGIWLVRFTWRSDRYQRRRMELLEAILHQQLHPDAGYEYQLLWGNDRRAVGPLEFRKHRNTGAIEWRYDGTEWNAGKVPGQIAAMFADVGVKL
jgi:hypothetical protein